MILTPASGPVGAPTSRDGAGLLAATAIQYQLEPGVDQEEPLPLDVAPTDPRGHVIAVGDVLRWFVHPTLDTALTWGSMHVALDLLFTDGSRLSDLDPRDQYGCVATATGLAEGKILYPDQWNDVQVRLDAAAGREIADVLVTGAAPLVRGADGDLLGWIDGPYVGPMPVDPPLEEPVAWVDTRRGTNASGDFSRGNTQPFTAWPNGFCFFTPATNARERQWLYEYQRTNDVDNRPRLQAIMLSHQPSPWMGDRNQFLMMPLLGEDPDCAPEARGAAFTHAQETARPDRYAVVLENGLHVRLAPTDHGAILEVDVPAGDEQSHLLLEGVDAHARIDAAGAVLDGALTGWVDSDLAEGNDRADGATRMFIAAQIDPSPLRVAPARGANDGAQLLTFPAGTRRVTLRLASSYLGTEQARRTFSQELAGRGFAEIADAARAVWNERLSVIRADGATSPQLRTLYGNLYRLNLYPNSHHENIGTMSAPRYAHASPVLPTRGAATDTTTNAQVVPGKMAVNNGFWDTYRTAWPAYALLYPQLAAELADGFVQQFREGGWIARWSSPGYADCMTGTSSDIAFADLFVKGVALPDPVGAYRSGLRNATTAPPSAAVGRKGNERAVFTGYVDTDTDESVSWALEACINDAGLAQMALRLADDDSLPETDRQQLREEAAYLRARSDAYALLFDERIGFFQGRRPDGEFAQDPDVYDPRVWGGDYTETDGWNFAFHAPHDGEGLAALHGGRDGLRAKLEELFATPELADRKGTYGHVIHEMVEARAVRMGQFGMSNQPSHHIPFLFHHAGAPHRASQIVREVHERLFVGEQIGQGYPGDEDNGEMSAWWLLTALGLYPLQLATGRYHLVAPAFRRAEVRPLGGEPFTVTADGHGAGTNIVQNLQVNGVEHPLAAIDHADLRGELRFTVGAEPAAWGDVPPSPTAPGAGPRPLQDLIEHDPSDPLFDDDSRTEELMDAAAVAIDLPLAPRETRAPRLYTLTSGAQEGGDPIAWRLEGSTDGVTWEVLDERSAQKFPWRRQTRPFQIADPRPLAQARLVVTTAQGPLRIAQIELLA